MANRVKRFEARLQDGKWWPVENVPDGEDDAPGSYKISIDGYNTQAEAEAYIDGWLDYRDGVADER